jgi:hypothetical protein
LVSSGCAPRRRTGDDPVVAMASARLWRWGASRDGGTQGGGGG